MLSIFEFFKISDNFLYYEYCYFPKYQTKSETVVKHEVYFSI